MHLADFLSAAGIEKHPLGDGGFTGIDVSNESYISYILNRETSGHFLTPYLWFVYN